MTETSFAMYAIMFLLGIAGIMIGLVRMAKGYRAGRFLFGSVIMLALWIVLPEGVLNYLFGLLQSLAGSVVEYMKFAVHSFGLDPGSGGFGDYSWDVPVGIILIIIGGICALSGAVMFFCDKVSDYRSSRQATIDVLSAVAEKRIAENKEKVIGWNLVDAKYLLLPPDELQERVDRAGVFSDDLLEAQVLLNDPALQGNSADAKKLRSELEATQRKLRQANEANTLRSTVQAVADFRERAQRAIHYINHHP